MRSLSARLAWPLVLLAILAMAGSPAYGQQGNTTTLSGVVVDDQGGVVPGADVLAKNNATAGTIQGVTDGTGRFVLAGVSPGTYTVTVTLMGFKTAVLPDVQVVSGTPASVKVTLKVGALEETVVVTGQTEVVQATSPNVASTIAVKQIQQLPVVSHTALDFVISLPGIETAGTYARGSTVMGLPTTSINITLDGINAGDKRGGEGMFMYIRPMMDSVEEVTVSTSNADAAATGAGAVNIKMETRSGSNRFSGSVYNTWRNQAGTNDEDVLTRNERTGWLWRLNTPYWFDKQGYRARAKTPAGDYYLQDTRLQTPGFRVGGPIVKDKLFYFFNYEEFRLPNTQARVRNIMSTAAMQGNFTYTGATDKQVHTVNVFNIAGANSLPTQKDPNIIKLLGEIRDAAGTTGSITAYDANLDLFSYAPASTQKRQFPTVRMDYNITNAHRVSFSYRYNMFDSTPDLLNNAEPKFPGFPTYAGQYSQRYMWQVNLRSTLGKSMVNEIRGGTSDAMGAGTYFGKGLDFSAFNCTGIGCQSSNGVGYRYNFVSISPGGGLTTATGYSSSSQSVAAQDTIEDTLTWLKGKHSMSFGGSWARTRGRGGSQTPFPMTLSWGVPSQWTAAYNAMHYINGAANFPGGISDADAGRVRNLYGFLIGSVTGIASTYTLQPDGTYVPNGPDEYNILGNDIGFFASDSWRVKPNLTLTLGVRYQVQLPMTTTSLYGKPQDWRMVYGITGAGDGRYNSGNLYKPGVLTGTDPVIVPYSSGEPAYNTDWNNIAPSVGAAWRPALKDGALSTILGKDPVFRGGYSITYTKQGQNFFDSIYWYNPGKNRAGSRGATSGTPRLGYDGWPVLLSQGGNVANNRVYPSQAPPALGDDWAIVPAVDESVYNHYPDWKVPMTHQYSFGWQRELGKSTAIDVRYVGNTNVGGWTNWNMIGTAQWSMLAGENGYYDEYRLAQANLLANIKAGKGNTFAYTGVAGTSPLPIFMAYYHGIPLNDARNKVPANYTSANFSSVNYYDQLRMYSPGLTGMAGRGDYGLQSGIGTGTGRDANRIAAGLPINFFMANPAVNDGAAVLAGNSGNTRFNAIQLELRRRLTGGLLVQGSYQYTFGRKTWQQRSLREDWYYIDSTGGYDHAIKANWVYELPFGRGKKFGSGSSALVDGFIGGWEIDGVARIQSGAKANYGGYRLVGMSEEEFASMIKFYHVIDPTVLDANGAPMDRVYYLPQDVIQNSIIALYKSSSTTVTGYQNDIVPTGKYLAPASGPDCVQYMAGMCPGTKLTRIVSGPWFWKVDLSIVKRIPVYKNVRVEARMDLFNVFDTINFLSNWAMGDTVTAWQITSAAQDATQTQDPGGRVTQFGLRVTW